MVSLLEYFDSNILGYIYVAAHITLKLEILQKKTYFYVRFPFTYLNLKMTHICYNFKLLPLMDIRDH